MKRTLLLICAFIAIYLSLYGGQVASSWRAILLNQPVAEEPLDPRFGDANEVAVELDTTPRLDPPGCLLLLVLATMLTSGLIGYRFGKIEPTPASN